MLRAEWWYWEFVNVVNYREIDGQNDAMMTMIRKALDAVRCVIAGLLACKRSKGAKLIDGNEIVLVPVEASVFVGTDVYPFLLLSFSSS